VVKFFIESESVELLRDDYLDEVVAGRFEVNAAPGQAVVLGGACELILVHPVHAEWLRLGAVVAKMERKAAATCVEMRLDSTGPKRRQVFESFLTSGSHSASDEQAGEKPAESEGSLVLDLIHSPESSGESILRPSQPTAAQSSEGSASAHDTSQEQIAPSVPPLDMEPLMSSNEEAKLSTNVSKASRQPSQKAGTYSGSYTQNIHQKVRTLSAPERERLARSGSQAERVALERAFGATLWEALLSNPQVTSPEVAKIAKNRTAPAPILQIIVGNRNWLNRPEIRRGLLSNTRLQAGQIERVLAACKRSELKQLQKQTAYPQRVRQAVAKLLGGLG
jgi:hypothetical protein